MKMIKILSIIFGLVFLINSCDKVDPPYTTGFDCESGNQNVLIEDYTGHTCVNCPGAAVTAHDIKANCEDRVIVVAVHAGYFAKPISSSDYSYDFRTQAGNDWNDYFAIVGNPNGLVNRTSENGSYVLGPGLWAEAAFKLLSQNSPLNIEIENSFNESNNTLSTKVTANIISDIEGVYDLIVCITEDHIIKPQKNNDASIGTVPDILEYEHNGVLRMAINGSWGQDFINGSANTGESISKNLVQSFDGTDWVAENCNVVAFIVNRNDKSVLQVDEHGVIN